MKRNLGTISVLFLCLHGGSDFDSYGHLCPFRFLIPEIDIPKIASKDREVKKLKPEEELERQLTEE